MLPVGALITVTAAGLLGIVVLKVVPVLHGPTPAELEVTTHQVYAPPPNVGLATVQVGVQILAGYD
jgi:hypothetical protein